MSTFLYSHPSCVQHDPGPMHPECPERLQAVLDGLSDEPFQHLSRHEAPEIDLHIVEMVHQPFYIEKILDGKVLGPVNSPIFRIRKKFRVRLLIRSKKTLNIQKKLAFLISNFKFLNGIKLTVDVDPINFN